MRKPPITETEEIFDIELEEDLLNRNRELAEANRRLLDEHGVRGLDVLGSIGSGKTTLVTEMIKRLKGRMEVAVLAGDLTTMIDAERIEEQGVPVLQIHTGKECHLDANLVRKALAELDLDGVDLLMIENVGNLICPSYFSLGVEARIVVVSASEGAHVIEKHPAMFQSAQLVALNKIDIAQAVNVDLAQPIADLAAMRPGLRVLKTNCLSGEGVDGVIAALDLA